MMAGRKNAAKPATALEWPAEGRQSLGAERVHADVGHGSCIIHPR